MSRGPGKWERAILAALEERESFWLRSLLSRETTKAQYNALLRAAMALEDKGRILIDRYAFGGEAWKCEGRTAIRRIGSIAPERLNVGKGHGPEDIDAFGETRKALEHLDKIARDMGCDRWPAGGER